MYAEWTMRLTTINSSAKPTRYYRVFTSAIGSHGPRPATPGYYYYLSQPAVLNLVLEYT